MNIFKENPWTVKLVASKFIVTRLVLGQNEFNNTPTNVPPICRLPAPNDKLGFNTYRANAFVRGHIEITPHGNAPFTRERGEQMTPVRWATEGGAGFKGLDEYNEFWCVTLRDPSEGIFLQTNYPLAPGESITITHDRPGMQRHLFVVEGGITIGSNDYNLFQHLSLTQPIDYVITNNTTEDAFVMYMYQVGVDEFIAEAGEPSIARERYDLIPIFSPEFWT
jgi:hypothetical protein